MKSISYKNIEHAAKRKWSFFLGRVLPVLAGIIFLLGATGRVEAAEVWAFTYQYQDGLNSATLISPAFPDKNDCEKQPVPINSTKVGGACKAYAEAEWVTMFNQNDTKLAAYNKQAVSVGGGRYSQE